MEPYPALVVDRAHNVLRANGALGMLMGFLLGAELAAAATRGPLNAIELLLSPQGMKPCVENWAEAATWSIRRLRAEAMIERGDKVAADLLAKMLQLPDVGEIARVSSTDQDFPPISIMIFRKDDTRLALFSMIATMGTPLDVSLQNLRLELFFPADDATAKWFSQAAKLP